MLSYSYMFWLFHTRTSTCSLAGHILLIPLMNISKRLAKMVCTSTVKSWFVSSIAELGIFSISKNTYKRNSNALHGHSCSSVELLFYLQWGGGDPCSKAGSFFCSFSRGFEMDGMREEGRQTAGRRWACDRAGREARAGSVLVRHFFSNLYTCLGCMLLGSLNWAPCGAETLVPAWAGWSTISYNFFFATTISYNYYEVRKLNKKRPSSVIHP